LSDTLSPTGAITIADIGSGNGVKGALVLELLRQRYHIPAYVALDVSVHPRDGLAVGVEMV
jgi:uncharacterized SAM-dependent methyltransferase